MRYAMGVNWLNVPSRSNPITQVPVSLPRRHETNTMFRLATMSKTSNLPLGRLMPPQGYAPPSIAWTTAAAQFSDSTRLLGPEALKIGAATAPL